MPGQEGKEVYQEMGKQGDISGRKADNFNTKIFYPFNSHKAVVSPTGLKEDKNKIN